MGKRVADMNRRAFLGLAPAVALTGGLAVAAAKKEKVGIVWFDWEESSKSWYSCVSDAPTKNGCTSSSCRLNAPTKTSLCPPQSVIDELSEQFDKDYKRGHLPVRDGFDRIICGFLRVLPRKTHE